MCDGLNPGVPGVSPRPGRERACTESGPGPTLPISVRQGQTPFPRVSASIPTLPWLSRA